MRWIINTFTGALEAVGSGGGGGGGTVTSVAGGVGITNTPEPIVGAGTVDLDINSLTTETSLASGDLFPFVDVSVGTAPSAQRKVTLGNIQTFLGGAFQPLDAGLTALSSLGAGIAVSDGADSWFARTLIAPAAGITISNANGVAGNPTFALANDLAALEGLGSTGIAVRSAVDTWVQRSIAVTDSASIDFTVTNGDGVAGNPTITGVVIASGVDHGGLGGLPDDDHTQYLLLAGRAGTANNPLISTNAEGIITGSSDNGFGLTLRAGTATPSIDHGITLLDNLTTVGSSGFIPVRFIPSITTTGGILGLVIGDFSSSSTTWTLNSALGVNAIAGLVMSPKIRNNPGVARTLVVSNGFFHEPIWEADGAVFTITDIKGFSGSNALQTVNAGTLTNTRYTELDSQPAVGAGVTIATYRGVWLHPSLGGGAVTTSVGFDLEDIGATTRMSLRSAGAATMRHAGNVRIGDTATAPSVALEVLGHALLDNGGTASELRLREPSAGGSSYTGFKAPSLAANLIYEMPGAFPTVNGQVLSGTTAGVLSWATPAATIIVQQRDVTIDAAVTTLDFQEPNAASNPITSSPAGEANVDLGLYVLRAGRSGTTNNVTLSTTIDGTLEGSSSAANLVLTSNAATPQFVNITDRVKINSIQSAAITSTWTMCDLGPSSTTTIALATGVRGVSCATPFTHTDNLSALQALRWIPTHTSGAATTFTLGAHQFVQINPTYTPGAASTFGITSLLGTHFNPTYSDAGVLNTLTSHYLARATGTMNGTLATTWTIDDWALGYITAPAGTGGTITRLGGIRVGSLTRGTFNYSLWSEGATTPMCHGGDALIGAVQTPTPVAPSATLHAQESTAIVDGSIGGEVFRAETLATNDDPNFRIFQGRVTTTNATVTTLLSFAIPATTTVLLDARVVARRTGGTAGTAEDGAAYIVNAAVKSVAGVATLLTAGATGSPTVVFDNNDQAAWNATIDVNLGNARVRVTGAANNNITWHCTLFVQNVGS